MKPNDEDTVPLERRSWLVWAGAGLVLATLVLIAVPNQLDDPMFRHPFSLTIFDMRSMGEALEAYHAEHQAYPPSLWALTTPMAYLEALPGDRYAGKKKAKDSVSRRQESFRYYQDGEGWIVWSRGPDRRWDLTEKNVGNVYTSRIPQPSETVLRLAYDATNGAESAGDFFRVKQ